jgi:hypothetical protein
VAVSIAVGGLRFPIRVPSNVGFAKKPKLWPILNGHSVTAKPEIIGPALLP